VNWLFQKIKKFLKLFPKSLLKSTAQKYNFFGVVSRRVGGLKQSFKDVLFNHFGNFSGFFCHWKSQTLLRIY
jgi:hypothetical protein